MYASISYIASSYFHQDFDLEADTPIGVVKVFRDSEDPEMAEDLQAEIITLLGANPSEEDLSKIWLVDGGADYDPRSSGITLRDWLMNIAEVLSESG
jgi:hypothetical protein